jgi:hypothetical protein
MKPDNDLAVVGLLLSAGVCESVRSRAAGVWLAGLVENDADLVSLRSHLASRRCSRAYDGSVPAGSRGQEAQALS